MKVLAMRKEKIFRISPFHVASNARFAGVMLLLALLTACSFSGRNQPGKTRPLRLAVGEVKEVRLRQSADSTLEISGTSENNEIVDITPKQPAGKSTQAARSNQAVFLIKGIIPGSAKVVISRKRTGEEGPGLPIRTYQVSVVTK